MAPTAGLSRLQRKALAALAHEPSGSLSSRRLYEPVFGLTLPSFTWPKPTLANVAPKLRVSLSRTLHRLRSRGLIAQTSRGFYVITDAGRDAVNPPQQLTARADSRSTLTVTG